MSNNKMPIIKTKEFDQQFNRDLHFITINSNLPFWQKGSYKVKECGEMPTCRTTQTGIVVNIKLSKSIILLLHCYNKMDNTWTLDVENVLCKIRQNAGILSKYHKKKYYSYKGYLKYFRIPTIVFSAISSVVSVGLQPYVHQDNVSLITCFIGLMVGIINSLELFLSIQTTMENELINSKEFYLLSVDIYKTLLLDSPHRGIGGQSYLDEKYNLYCKLIENSELVEKNITDKLVYIELNKSGNSRVKIANSENTQNCCWDICSRDFGDYNSDEDELFSKLSSSTRSPENGVEIQKIVDQDKSFNKTKMNNKPELTNYDINQNYTEINLENISQKSKDVTYFSSGNNTSIDDGEEKNKRENSNETIENVDIIRDRIKQLTSFLKEEKKVKEDINEDINEENPKIDNVYIHEFLE